jgi:hypothetical protein
MFDLTDEEKIVLLASRLYPSAEDLKCIENMVGNTENKIDYQRLIKVASLNGVAPFLRRTFRRINTIPGNISAKLEDIYNSAIFRNTNYLHATFEILQLLRDHGIDAIALKGAIASEMIFEDPGLYISSDIDILVKHSELEKTKKILINSGYKFDKNNENYMFRCHYHVSFHKDKHVVEVHWNLVKHYFSIPPEFWWEHTITQIYENREIRSLETEKYLLYLIFRLFSHDFFPLKFFVIISELINRYENDIEWKRFFALCDEYKMKRLSVFTLKLTKELLDAKIPEFAIKENIFRYKQMKKDILAGLFQETKKPHLKVLLMDTRLEILKAIIKRLFPNSAELRVRYGIPEKSKKMYLYYFLNPVLIPLFIVRKRMQTKIYSSRS